MENLNYGIIKIHGIELTDDQYLEILDIMKRNSQKSISKQQVIHFVVSGWYALNQAWYKEDAQSCFNSLETATP